MRYDQPCGPRLRSRFHIRYKAHLSSLLNYTNKTYPGNLATPLSRLEWSSLDEPAWKLDDYSLKPLTPPAHHLVESADHEYHDFTLAISGDVFRWMINHAPLETLQRVSLPLAHQGLG